MATLPPSGELSRWTVNQISNWLAKCSLSVFRDDFLRDKIDGSKLMRLTAPEVNQKYRHVSSKKRNILIDHLNKIECSRQPATWNTAGFGTNTWSSPQPVQNNDDSDESDGSWGDKFDDDEEEDSDGGDYLQPIDERPKGNTANGTGVQGPEEAYEVPDVEAILQPQGLQRRDTIADKLKNALAQRKARDAEPTIAEPSPPPRPPRSNKGLGGPSPRSVSPAHRNSPMPLPPSENLLPPDDVYEEMNDVISETQKAPPQHFHDAEASHSPRPAPRVANKRAPERLPVEKPAQKPRQPYTQVNKPGRLAQQDELSGYAWYHGMIGRVEAQSIIEREEQDGMFLIRKSERNPKQPYTLVIWHGDRSWNLPIRKKDDGKYAAGKYKDGETEFTSVPELVDHFKVVSLNLKSSSSVQGSHTLTVPAPKH